MSKKLYSAIFLGFSALVAKESGSSVDLFTNPVGTIGQVKQPDLFNNPVGQIGIQTAPAVENKQPAVQTSESQVGQNVQPAVQAAPVVAAAESKPAAT